ncbi:FAD-binding and (Fe-S)-binding domain-containing protein [Streptomyces sp. NBS 14/10]|uniref:FAD-binding and (Fe-S)-binding domain-containing protein n=1 Tax=Streptomyces sp. NBS 14/10 TaxID=1945643 RepID=UPI000B9D2CB2|nr:FAD-binding and (Fe-S)-binding domain-containing protein [Streptomyces sp. NBS 14/10]KAK1185691.1 FAD-binding and (Fe-S)-binding domain-containing protein [Streptomyces sp. NBS 14/10]
MTGTTPSPATTADLAEALRREVPSLRVDTSGGRRAQYAYDASNYRVPPLAVAFPADADEVVGAHKVCHRLGVPVTSRGAGTSMAGNAVGAGLVLDLSRHLRRVLDIDADGRTARVEAGIVLDDLQDAAAPYGLVFGPDPSSHSRCTIGGMIGNDACGNHSVRYGRTGEHLVALDLVLADGTRAIADRDGLRAVDEAGRERVAELTAGLRAIVEANLAAIRLTLGRIPRQVSGYQLQHLLPEHGFDVVRVLAGTEGTCATVVSATVRLMPKPPAALLVALGYDDVVDAAEDVPLILKFSPAAVEGLDEAIVATMRHRRGAASVTGLPEGRAWLYVDLDGEEPQQVAAEAEHLLDELKAAGRMVSGRLITDRSERASLWRVREDGAGLAARLTDGSASWPGWEDAAVAPDRLAGYLRDFRALMADHRLTGVLYGHFGAGCVHVRIDFRPDTDDGRAAMRAFLTDAARLVVRHGGTLSGEHGDGRARGELLSVMYDRPMLEAFAAFKHAWDPDGLLNPGILVDPRPLDADLALDTGRTTTPSTVFALLEDPDGIAGAANRCVGVGRCRSHSGGVMCPSYRATGDEQHSTRGRARTLQEMLRGALPGGWRSRETREALDLCLSCKACSSDCPVGVDMATYKSEFLHHHYRWRPRPRSHYSLGWLPLWAALAGRMPKLVNAVMGSRLGPWIARLGGVTTKRSLPAFHGWRAWRRGLAAGPAEEATSAVLVVDSFTRAFRPELAGAASRVLAEAGLPTRARGDICCGLTWITTGQLGIARRVLARTAAALDTPEGGPIVVTEPSCAATLAKDLPELVDSDAARRVAARVRTFTGALAERVAAGWRPGHVPDEVVLQTHCHQYAVFGAGQQRHLLRDLGIEKITEATGCCGVAGNFGFEHDHYDVSLAVADQALRPRLEAADPGTPVLADGFSCQMQIEHLVGDDRPGATHLAQLLDDAPSPSRT